MAKQSTQAVPRHYHVWVPALNNRGHVFHYPLLSALRPNPNAIALVPNVYLMVADESGTIGVGIWECAS